MRSLQQRAPCPILSALYKSSRPQAFLSGESITLSPVILSCCACCSDHKSLLGENWTTKTAAETASAAPTFNPAAPEYNELALRLGQSIAIQRWHDLSVRCEQLTRQLSGLTGDAKEAKQQELAEAQQQLADCKTALADMQASFEQDPLSLAPWTNALFALADSGCSTFDAGGGGWPPPQQLTALLPELLGPLGGAAAAGGPAAISSWLYGGAERVLGAFKRRYEAERGPGRVSIFTRLALHCFGEDSPAQLAAAVEGAVERSRQAVLGPEAAAAGAQLDLVQLHWMDYQEHDFLPVLLELDRLARPKCQAAEDGSGGLVVVEQPRVASIGLVQPPPEAITAALCAGVHLACVTVTYSLLDVSAEPVVQLCRARGIKVFADGALAHGLISEAFLGVAQPGSQGSGDGANGSSTSLVSGGLGAEEVEARGPDNLAAGLNMVARYGGWMRFQELLRCIKFIADKHKVSMEAVALRWLIDQGLFPVVGARWRADVTAGPWATFGHPYGLRPNEQAAAAADGGVRFVSGIDAALFQVASFLDAGDVAAIHALQGGGQ